MALNAKQRAFAAQYIVDKNATQAAIRAGYSAKTAGVQAHKLLKNTEIQSVIQKHMDKAAEKAEISAEYVLNSIKRIAESAEALGESSAALKGHELLGKHLKLFTDKVEHSGKVDSVTINVK